MAGHGDEVADVCAAPIWFDQYRCGVRRAAVGAVRYGVAFTLAICVGSCGAVMLAMFVSVHNVHLMVPLTVDLGRLSVTCNGPNLAGERWAC